MAVNTDFVGRTYPPTPPYQVSRAKIAELAAAVGATDPVHTDVEHARSLGYADVVAPPTFAVILAMEADNQLMADPEAGVHYDRVVHGEQTFVHHHPLTAGDEITTVMTVDAVKTIAGNTLVTTRSELSTVTGEPRCTATCMLVIRAEEH